MNQKRGRVFARVLSEKGWSVTGASGRVGAGETEGDDVWEIMMNVKESLARIDVRERDAGW